MRKQRRQPSFATLTDAEIEQIAQSLDGAIYAAVRAQVNKPRSEGGYGLHLTTDRPLEILWKRTKTVEKINTHILKGEKLTLATFAEITAGDAPATEEIHNAILFETMETVRSGGNSPHQLLALQRLADFPARAELREQAAAIRAERMDLVRAKEQRAQEMHTHKITLDLRKFEHKLEMDTFHKQIATARLDLQKQTLALREKQHQDRLASPSPLRGERVAVRGSSIETSAQPSADDLTSLPDHASHEDRESDAPQASKRFPTPNPLPHDIYLKNCAYTEKLLAGLVDPLTGKVLDDPAPASLASDFSSNDGGTRSPSPTLISRDAIDEINAAPADPASNPNHLLKKLSSAPNTCACNAQARNRTDVHLTSPSASIPVPVPPIDPVELAARVDRYTVDRVREYIAHNQQYTPWPHRHSPPEFITEARHCPCGHACPCPIHETEGNGGPFPEYFWKLSPLGSLYADHLEARNLPYRLPREYLP